MYVCEISITICVYIYAQLTWVGIYVQSTEIYLLALFWDAKQ